MIVAFVISLTSLGGVMYMYMSLPKTAYVRVGYLYDNFQFKKELESKLTTIVSARKTVLDSLELHLKVLSNSIERSSKKDGQEIEKFNQERQQYLMKKQQFEEDQQNQTKQYSDEISKQISQYVEDYGKANGYTYLYGATGNGTILSANDKYDITTTVLEYINERYKGKK